MWPACDWLAATPALLVILVAGWIIDDFAFLTRSYFIIRVSYIVSTLSTLFNSDTCKWLDNWRFCISDKVLLVTLHCSYPFLKVEILPISKYLRMMKFCNNKDSNSESGVGFWSNQAEPDHPIQPNSSSPPLAIYLLHFFDFSPLCVFTCVSRCICLTFLG